MKKKEIIKKNKSLKVKITIWLVIIVLISQGIFSAIKIFTDGKKTYNELEISCKAIADELSGSVVSSLWNYDLDQTKTLVDIKLKNRDFVGMIIYDSEKGNPVLGLVKGIDGINETLKIDEKRFIKISHDLSYDGKVYWKADYFFTDEYVKKAILLNIFYSILNAIVLTVIISVFMFIVMNRLVINPIKAATSMLKDIKNLQYIIIPYMPYKKIKIYFLAN